MITISMLRQQVLMADDDDLNRILEIPQRILKLNAQYENHPYVEEFTKECIVMFIYGTYILEGEADAKFSFGKIWNLLKAGPFSNNAKKLLLANDKLYDGIEIHTKNIRFSSEYRDNQANTQDNDG